MPLLAVLVGILGAALTQCSIEEIQLIASCRSEQVEFYLQSLLDLGAFFPFTATLIGIPSLAFGCIAVIRAVMLKVRY